MSTAFTYLSQNFSSDSEDEDMLVTPKHNHVDEFKSVLDPIHGFITVHPLCWKIIDTPEFQRLRDIQQLGGASYVFPGATHNRFQHSIGVYYLARLYMENFQKKQPELCIQEKDILMVSIAGLCHDLGHGIKSHLYDTQFLRIMNKGEGWSHEIMSTRLLQLIIDKYNLLPLFENYDLYAEDIHCIYEMILGSPKEAPDGWEWTGMKGKEYMYQIVANKNNGIDVDKFDYYSRDSYYLGIPSPMVISRIIEASRVRDRSNKAYDICYAEKAAFDIYEFFHSRASLHKRVYQHKVCKSIEIMLTEVLIYAEKGGYTIKYNDQEYKLSDIYKYPEVYVQATDWIYHDIMNKNATTPDMKKAQYIMNRILNRDLYKCVGEFLIDKTNDKHIQVEELETTLFDICNQKGGNVIVDKDDILCQVVSIDFGMKKNNPVNNVVFFSKHKHNDYHHIEPHEISRMLPDNFIDTFIRIYSRNIQHCKPIQEAFEQWYQQHEDQINDSSDYGRKRRMSE
ncbi:hypothetical protein WA158_001032 [Blastocystis sp. Blastoise]